MSPKQFILDKNIDLVVVGPEAPLVEGMRDYFKSNSALNRIQFVGPDQQGAMLEGSKDFAKNKTSYDQPLPSPNASKALLN